MARPFTLPADVQARLASSTLPPTVLVKQLAAEGVTVSLRTVQRARARAKGAPPPLGAATADLRRRRAEEPPPPPELAPDDDLGRLARRRDEIDRALDSWQGQLALSPQAVRAYRALSAELATLTRTLVELRPRPEAEQERLAALGTGAIAELLERARAAATPDDVSALRLKVADLERANGILRKALAE